MDIEKELRSKLCESLSAFSSVSEEVPLTTRDGRSVRADVLAISDDNDGKVEAIAFEVKTASGRNFQKWTEVFLQAFSYVGATTKDGQKIISAFVYPGPPYSQYGPQGQVSEYWRDEQCPALAGVLHMASRLNVGSGYIRSNGASEKLGLLLGPHEIWGQDHGWSPTGKKLLRSAKRQLIAGMAS